MTDEGVQAPIFSPDGQALSEEEQDRYIEEAAQGFPMLGNPEPVEVPYRRDRYRVLFSDGRVQDFVVTGDGILNSNHLGFFVKWSKIEAKSHANKVIVGTTHLGQVE